MRLWTIHPKYLDGVGLVALWREALLARAVLKGETRGYRRHPQLIRFQEAPRPRDAIGAYLRGIYDESLVRGYTFDPRKLGARRATARITETKGQMMAEWEHLMRKLKKRRPALHRDLVEVDRPVAHPLFRVVAGAMRAWERSGDADR